MSARFVDGTKIQANASKHAAVSYAQAVVDHALLIVGDRVSTAPNDKRELKMARRLMPAAGGGLHKLEIRD